MDNNSILEKCSFLIISKLENFFFNYGCFVAKYPKCCILFCLLLTGICSIGLLNFTLEDRPLKLWVPQDSDTISVIQWKRENFPNNVRVHLVIIEADNVLNKNVLLEMLKIHKLVSQLSTTNATWESVCAKVPLVPNFDEDNIKTSNGVFANLIDFNFLNVLPRQIYCKYLQNLKMVCLENSILEIWNYDQGVLESLSQKDIIDDINYKNKSLVYNYNKNFTELFGGIERDASGQMIKAKALKHLWFTQINASDVASGDYVYDSASGKEVDTTGFNWEDKFIKTILNKKKQTDIKEYLMAASSFHHIAGNTILSDVKFMVLGFCIVFVYVQIMLGKFNCVEQRPLLSLLGLTAIGLSIFLSYGICSFAGIFFSPVHNILPFLLLGLGVDDMFVIMQAWHNLASNEQTCPLEKRIGLALKHAGVSITITSLTDFAAFAIGSTTSLPALQSFCLFAAVGVIALYFLQATYFVALLTLDQRRLEDDRHGFFFCYKFQNWTPNKCSQNNLCQIFFRDYYSNFILNKYIRIIILLLTLVLSGFCLWGLTSLEQEFNPVWFIPSYTYLSKFFVKQEKYFSSYGEMGEIYFGNIDLFEDLHKIDKLVYELKENEGISQVDSWYEAFKIYWNTKGYEVPDPDSNKEDFLYELQEFLFSPSGSKYRFANFKFATVPNCTGDLPTILASSINYRHVMLFNTETKVKAMNSIKDTLERLNFSGYAKPFALSYSGWETDEIIEMELYKNLILAMIVIFVMTLSLIASLSTTLMVLLCVMLTLIDTGAVMHWWGLTIDTVSSIDLVLAVGLCVDYAAHIGHTFMTLKGTKKERTVNTLGVIGPAVLNGGFSTFLVIVLLSQSESHVFITFFKVFFCVCIFGLYHGLVLLPIMLSIVGPAPYKSTFDAPVKHTAESHELKCEDVNGSAEET